MTKASNTYQFDTDTRSTYLQNINHNPLDLGDNSSIPDKNTTPTGFWSPPQTWWGFPTWRETLSVNWTDPDPAGQRQRQLRRRFGQPNGLTPRPANTVPVAGERSASAVDVDAGDDQPVGAVAERLSTTRSSGERRSSSATS